MRPSLCAAVVLFASSLAAHADTVYNYTGQDFLFAAPPYTTSSHVTGSFTVASALGDNLSNYTFTPESFSFNDSVQTLASAQSLDDFLVSTDSNGNIVGYTITVGATNQFIHLANDTNGNTFDAASDVSAGGGGFSDAAGSFTRQTAVTPEPSGIALLGSGMLAIAGVLRKRFA